MTHTIKTYRAGDEIARVTLTGSDLVQYAPATCYGVIDGSGKLVVKANRLTGKPQQELYSLKSAAQQQADWYNRQAN